jgi:putative GTP pyrophosphokinase
VRARAPSQASVAGAAGRVYYQIAAYRIVYFNDSYIDRSSLTFMVDKNIQERILAEYDANAHVYAILAPKLEQLLREILSSRGIQVHSITSRPKGRRSLAGKLAKDDANYEGLADLTDLVGLRVTTYFAEDVDRVADAIAEEFDIDLNNSIDKRRSLAADRFGYLSLHHVLSLRESRCELTEYKAFKGVKVELQTRSILQHAWAEIEHDLGYKSEIEVPQHIRRRFALVAGLLELADREFDGIKKELENYRIDLLETVQNTPEDVSLNLDSMRVLLESESIATEMDRIIEDGTKRISVGYFEAASALYLTRMEQMGMKTVGNVTTALRDNESLILKFAEYFEAICVAKDEERGKKGYIGAGVSLYYLWLLWLSTKSEGVIKEILKDNNHVDPDYYSQVIIYTAAKVREELSNQ